MEELTPILIIGSWLTLFVLILYFIFCIRSFNLTILAFILFFYTVQGYLLYFMYEYLGITGSHTSVVMDYPYYSSPGEPMFYAVVLMTLFWMSYIFPLVLIPKREFVNDKRVTCNRIIISSSKLFFIGFLLLSSYILYFSPILREGLEIGNVYLLYKGSFVDMPFGRIFQQLLLIASILFLLGSINGQYGRYLYISNKIYFRALNIFAVTLVFLMMTMLGDKITVVGTILFVVCIGQFTFKPRIGIFFGILAVVCVGNSISVIRFVDFSSDWSLLDIVLGSFLSLVDHAESVTSLSLFVALRNHIPCTYGTSIIDALFNLVPTFVYKYQKIDPFTYYASYFVPADNAIGWGISIFTDLFINFSIYGVVFGGLLLGAFHRTLYIKSNTSFFGAIFFASIVSVLPTYYRNGINFTDILYALFVALIINVIAKYLLTSKC